MSRNKKIADSEPIEGEFVIPDSVLPALGESPKSFERLNTTPEKEVLFVPDHLKERANRLFRNHRVHLFSEGASHSLEEPGRYFDDPEDAAESSDTFFYDGQYREIFYLESFPCIATRVGIVFVLPGSLTGPLSEMQEKGGMTYEEFFQYQDEAIVRRENDEKRRLKGPLDPLTQRFQGPEGLYFVEDGIVWFESKKEGEVWTTNRESEPEYVRRMEESHPKEDSEEDQAERIEKQLAKFRSEIEGAAVEQVKQMENELAKREQELLRELRERDAELAQVRRQANEDYEDQEQRFEDEKKRLQEQMDEQEEAGSILSTQIAEVQELLHRLQQEKEQPAEPASDDSKDEEPAQDDSILPGEIDYSRFRNWRY